LRNCFNAIETAPRICRHRLRFCAIALLRIAAAHDISVGTAETLRGKPNIREIVRDNARLLCAMPLKGI
jgi:hypothetical protein